MPKVINFEYPVKFEIVNYMVSYMNHKDNSISLPTLVSGPLFGDKFREVIDHRLQVGDVVFFDEVNVRGPAGDIRKINPMTFAVIR